MEWVLLHEGGFSNHPHDRGGVTKYGISLRFLENMPDGDVNQDSVINSADITGITRDQAIDFYRRKFWNKYRYGLIMDASIATKIFDFAVNMGPTQAHRLTQYAILACGHNLAVDGRLGPKTLALLNTVNRDVFLAALRAEAAAFYRAVADRNPSQKVFLNGWLRRAYAQPHNGENT